MAKVARYLPAAVEDLHSIWSYAADSSQSEDVADRLIAAIDERIHFYAQNAEIGTPRFELGRDLRCFTVASFVVFYLSTAAESDPDHSRSEGHSHSFSPTVAVTHRQSALLSTLLLPYLEP